MALFAHIYPRSLILICDGFVDGSGERGLDLFGRRIFEK